MGRCEYQVLAARSLVSVHPDLVVHHQNAMHLPSPECRNSFLETATTFFNILSMFYVYNEYPAARRCDLATSDPEVIHS